MRFWAFSYSIGDPCERSLQVSMYFTVSSLSGVKWTSGGRVGGLRQTGADGLGQEALRRLARQLPPGAYVLPPSSADGLHAFVKRGHRAVVSNFSGRPRGRFFGCHFEKSTTIVPKPKWSAMCGQGSPLYLSAYRPQTPRR